MQDEREKPRIITLDEFQIEDFAAIAAQAARRFKRKHWWADDEELRQEAWAAILKANADGGWDPNYGSDLEGYLYRAAYYALRPYVWANASILSAPYHKLGDLFSQRTEPISDDAVVGAAIVEFFNDSVRPDLKFERIRWSMAVRSRLSEIFGSLEDGEIAEARLMLDLEPEDISRALHVPVQRVYAAARRAKRRIGNDYTLFQLWDERPA